jgi:hypothetical protein
MCNMLIVLLLFTLSGVVADDSSAGIFTASSMT